MNLRLAILALTDKYQLSAQHHAELKRLAGLEDAPPALSAHLQTGISLLGAALGGLGVLFWIAANWQALSGLGRFALLEAVLAGSLLGAWRRPVLRVPLSLLGFLACGGLFAHFGQTYQTGADPWQLFALWAVLTLPLCLSVCHSALWTAWAVVALTAPLLWAGAPDARSIFHGSSGSWLPALALAFALRHAPGAGSWPVRLCMIYATAGMVFFGVLSLFGEGGAIVYPLTLAALAVSAYAFSRRPLFDVFVISALGLGINVLLVAGVARVLVEAEVIGMLLIGCIAAALLAGTVKYIMHLTRLHHEEPAA